MIKLHIWTLRLQNLEKFLLLAHRRCEHERLFRNFNTLFKSEILVRMNTYEIKKVHSTLAI